MKLDKYPIPTTCPYCNSKVIYTSNAEIYGREYGNGRCYKCVSCDAYVGVHDGTDIPLGRLANKELRDLKKQCHALFDPVWKQEKNIKRTQLYEKLARKLCIPTSECHFGWFDEEMLTKALTILQKPSWYLDGKAEAENRRGQLLKRLCNYHTIPGHGPNISEMSDDALELRLNMLESMFEAAYREKEIEDEDI